MVILDYSYYLDHSFELLLKPVQGNVRVCYPLSINKMSYLAHTIKISWRQEKTLWHLRRSPCGGTAPHHAETQKQHLWAHSCEAAVGRFMKFTKIWIKFKPFYTALLLIKAVCAVKTSHLNRAWVFKNFECTNLNWALSLIRKCTVGQFTFSIKGGGKGDKTPSF